MSPVDLSAGVVLSNRDRCPMVDVSQFGSFSDFSDMLRGGRGFSFEDFLGCLPRGYAGEELRLFVEGCVEVLCRREDAGKRGEKKKGRMCVVVGIGGHFIKLGLAPFLIELMRYGYVDVVAMNGGALLHDVEVALFGSTSEDVDKELHAGAFGFFSDPSGFVNESLRESDEDGYGASVIDSLRGSGRVLPGFGSKSILWSAGEYGVSVTCHVGMGQDINHMHGDFDGGIAGKKSHYDFRVFCNAVRGLPGGVYMNIGSAVALPEVFLKAFSVFRNQGQDQMGDAVSGDKRDKIDEVDKFLVADFDFVLGYRSRENVLRRPVGRGGGSHYGRAFSFLGHNEIMVPLVFCAILMGVQKRLNRGA